MCTVSWVRNTDGYVLLFNRDEMLTRSEGLGPTVEQRNSVSFIAPVDGDYGGTWLGINQFGLTLGLLNRFDDGRPAAGGYVSRGLLLRNLLDCAHCNQVLRRVSKVKLKQFRPFTLFALSDAERAMRIEWNGRECRIQPDAETQMPLTSSSLKHRNVVVSRRKLLLEEMAYERGRVDIELLNQFHRSHLPKRGPYSVCMHRDDAATVSLSTVTVNRSTVEFSYQPNSPCLGAPTEKLLIERKQFHSRAASS